jgi:Ca-activated chloride channel homolog
MDTTIAPVHDSNVTNTDCARRRPPPGRRLLVLTAVLGLLISACAGGGRSEETFQDVGNQMIDGSGRAGPMSLGGSGTAFDVADDAMAESAAAAGDPSTNVFAPASINPWVDTGVDAQSTFALDVDTGSFTLVRSYLEGDRIPPPEAVRVEEIVNYLDYAYPDPVEGDFGIELAGSATPFTSEDDDVRLVRVGLQSRRIDGAQRRHAALTFVVDTSGSMDMDNRIGLVRRSLVHLVQQLRPSDTIALVEFGSEARVILGHTPVAESERILGAIDGLVTGGSTNVEAGLRLAYQQAREGFSAGGINRVIFAGDGMANLGVSDPDGLSEQLRADADDGIQLLTLGFGMGHYSDHLMEQLAREGDGFYAYVDDDREADRLFGEQLVSTLQTLALDAKVQVTFDPQQVAAFRLVGFENRGLAHEDFLDDTVDAGDIGAGHAVTALYEVQLASSVDPDATMASVGLRWADPDTGEVIELTADLTAGEITGTFTDAPVSLQRAAVAGYYAEVLRGSPYVTERGVTMVQVDQVAQSVLGAGGADGRFDELVALVGRAATLGGGS